MKRLLLGITLILVVAIMSACAPSFSIVGSWKQTYGEPGWDSQNGRIVWFDDSQCNIFSPLDTYGISDKTSDSFTLSVSGLLGGNLTYSAVILDSNNIDVYSSGKDEPTFSFTRLE